LEVVEANPWLLDLLPAQATVEEAVVAAVALPSQPVLEVRGRQALFKALTAEAAFQRENHTTGVVAAGLALLGVLPLT